MRQHRRLAKRVLAAIVCMSVATSLAACSFSSHDAVKPSTSSATPAGPISVVATIRPWGSLAEELGGDQVKVTTIITDSNLATKEYEPKTSDIATIAQSRILVVNGAGYDDWASKSLPKDATLVSASDAVGAAEGDNPYLWFSKDVRTSMATEMSEALSKALPAKKKYFNTRLKAWKKTETTLEQTMKQVASQSAKKMTYAQERPLAYYLMADLQFSDKTPQQFAQTLSNNEQPSDTETEAFETLLSSAKHPTLFLKDSTQQSTEVQHKLLQAAQNNSVPTVDVTEEMPAQRNTLNGWITDIITHIVSELKLKTQDGSDDAASQSATSSQSASDTQSTAASSAH